VLDAPAAQRPDVETARVADLVIDAVRGAGEPLVVTLAGGYARRVEDTVAIHVATIEEARVIAGD